MSEWVDKLVGDLLSGKHEKVNEWAVCECESERECVCVCVSQ